jgi:hypothetical protein
VCLSCGCGEPHDDHGNPDNITYDDLVKAAAAESLTVDQVRQNLMEGLEEMEGS